MQAEPNQSDPEGVPCDSQDLSTSKPRRRSPWKLLAGFGLLTLLIPATYGLMGSTRPERKEFVSRVHPISGARCRFTLSADWLIRKFSYEQSEEAPEAYTFTAPPPNSVQRWTDRYLRHHEKYEPSILYLTSYNAQHLPGHLKILMGFPETNLPPSVHVVTHRNLQLDHCPATLITLEQSTAHSNRGSYLLVYGPDQEFVYIMGSATTPSNADQADREIQAIMASFHVEKVAPPPVGRRADRR